MCVIRWTSSLLCRGPIDGAACLFYSLFYSTIYLNYVQSYFVRWGGATFGDLVRELQ